MGHTGNHMHPDVQSTIDGAIKKIVDSGRNAGALVTDENRQRYLEMGVTFTMTSWLSWVAKGAVDYKTALASVKR
jgi:2-keto-3-deoxy-L-rhamnonate aldolase RhmA